MIRLQIQVDPSTHEALRRKAFEEGRSLAAVARDLLTRGLRSKPAQGPRYDFESISGIIKNDPENVSEEHDRYVWGDDEP